MTPHQKRVLSFITAFISEKSYAPSYQEISLGVGIKSLATVSKHLDSLESRGLIVREENTRRSIRVTGKCPACGKAA